MAVDPATLLRTGTEQLGFVLPAPTREALHRYFNELCRWNRKMNLVAAAPDPEIIEKHFLDSLTLLPLLRRQPSPDLLDIGTGAGFPGLVLKVAIPQLEVTLVEPRQKRVAFLRHVIRTLGLKKVEVVTARLPGKGESPLPLPGYHLVTSRALSDLAGFLELAASYCLPGGRVVCMKGSRGPEELKSWQETTATEFRLIETEEYRLPGSGAYRLLYIFQKSSN
jgi:16S rRNA (guanine527-N7)-methyltransferase